MATLIFPEDGSPPDLAELPEPIYSFVGSLIATNVDQATFIDFLKELRRDDVVAMRQACAALEDVFACLCDEGMSTTHALRALHILRGRFKDE